MKVRTLIWSAAVVVVVVAAAAWAIRHTMSGKPASTPAPKLPAAHVDSVLKENDFNKVTLTPAAEENLGIRVTPLVRRAVSQSHVYGGEVTVPAGQTVIVAAPVGGILKAPAAGLPVAGTHVKRGQEIFALLPLLTPEGRTTLATAKVDAEGQVEGARTQLDAAKVALERAKRLLRQEAGSRRVVEESQAAYDIAAQGLSAANARHDLLSKVLSDSESGTAAPLAIESPQDGVLRNVSALPNQNVPSGAPLFEVVDTTTMWVRVPVAVGDLDRIDSQASARVGPLTARPGKSDIEARPATAPPSANSLAATVDLVYEVANSEGKFLPGQRVGATLTLRGTAEAAVIPWSAVVYDIYGGTWVYERVAERSYARRRVDVRYVAGDEAVLGEGPAPGTSIVADGAQELFGVETGFSK